MLRAANHQVEGCGPKRKQEDIALNLSYMRFIILKPRFITVKI